MNAVSALLASALAVGQAVPGYDVVTGDTVITGCTERVHHPPGRLERFEGVWYTWIDNGGFVPCSTLAECRRFLELDSLDFTATEEASDQLRVLQMRFRENWGVYRIRFVGRRGAMTLPNCIDHTLPDLPAYVRVERVLSLERLDDLKE